MPTFSFHSEGRPEGICKVSFQNALPYCIFHAESEPSALVLMEVTDTEPLS